MNRTERFYRIDQLLHERRVVPLAIFLDELVVEAPAALKRRVAEEAERIAAQYR